MCKICTIQSLLLKTRPPAWRQSVDASATSVYINILPTIITLFNNGLDIFTDLKHNKYLSNGSVVCFYSYTYFRLECRFSFCCKNIVCFQFVLCSKIICFRNTQFFFSIKQQYLPPLRIQNFLLKSLCHFVTMTSDYLPLTPGVLEVFN